VDRRVWVIAAIPLGLVACERAPVAPVAPAAPVAAEAGAVQVVRMRLPEDRRTELAAAVADARLRLLPALGEQEASLSVGAALEQLDAALAGDDATAVKAAVQAAELAMSAVPAEQAESLEMELDAIRLALGELTLAAAGPAIAEQVQ
jgi:hypothetical protein